MPSANVPNVVSLMVSQVCIVHREEDQECSLGVHRNGCGNGLKFLHRFLSRIAVHLGTNPTDLNSFSFMVPCIMNQ